jgi:hypothetical protein
MNTLAFLALAWSLLAPAGFMPTLGAGHGLTITICTGHGPLRYDPPGDHKAPPAKSKASACPFAANITPPPPPAAIAWSGPVAHDTANLTAAVSQAPGRGLAAPPPPATGPPVLI